MFRNSIYDEENKYSFGLDNSNVSLKQLEQQNKILTSLPVVENNNTPNMIISNLLNSENSQESNLSFILVDSNPFPKQVSEATNIANKMKSDWFWTDEELNLIRTTIKKHQLELKTSDWLPRLVECFRSIGSQRTKRAIELKYSSEKNHSFYNNRNQNFSKKYESDRKSNNPVDSNPFPKKITEDCKAKIANKMNSNLRWTSEELNIILTTIKSHQLEIKASDWLSTLVGCFRSIGSQRTKRAIELKYISVKSKTNYVTSSSNTLNKKLNKQCSSFLSSSFPLSNLRSKAMASNNDEAISNKIEVEQYNNNAEKSFSVNQNSLNLDPETNEAHRAITAAASIEEKDENEKVVPDLETVLCKHPKGTIQELLEDLNVIIMSDLSMSLKKEMCRIKHDHLTRNIVDLVGFV
jgi:hypothetical protein